ncbi:acetylxylan esterase [Homoserinibacter sp. GY 40078]|nr:acetylxylan esterase [Homoserinibacter sp. GY 40078]TXK19914.1 acetylxylan esterase [Homoserinibacter sp. GY 40078]
MTFTDLDLDELHAYRPQLAEPADLDGFWERTLSEARAAGAAPRLVPVERPVRALELVDLTFSGFGGEPVRAWLTRPRDAGPHPVVVEFVGYGGGRGLPGEKLAWASAGYAHILMDTRGQGGGWSIGETPDPHGSDPSAPGFMTRGILNPETYYYRRLFTDAVRLIDTVSEIPGLDAERIAVTGTSQGGGVAIAAAALATGVRAVMPDVPFLCDFPRAIVRTPSAPFTEITRFLSVHRDAYDAVLHTLSHIDGAILARRITAPALFSVGLMDEVVLPSGVFAAYHALASEDRELTVYTYNGHEGGAMHHWQRQVEWLDERFGMPGA